MCSRKSVKSRMEPWGTPALTGHPCGELPSTTTWSHLLLRNDKIRSKCSTIPYELSLWRRPASQTLSKALDISIATAQATLDLLKIQAILSDTTLRRSIVDQENLKPYWKSENRPDFSNWSTNLLWTSFSKTLLTIERRLIGWYCLDVDLSLTYINTGTTNATFQQSEKTILLQIYIEE